MTVTEEKDIREIAKKLSMLDEHDRGVVSITVNMLLAIKAYDEAKEAQYDERREEKGSPDGCPHDASAEL